MSINILDMLEPRPRKKCGVKAGTGTRNALQGSVAKSVQFAARCTPNQKKRYQQLQATIKREVLDAQRVLESKGSAK